MVNNEFQNKQQSDDTSSIQKGAANLRETIADKAGPAMDYLRDNFSNVGGRTQDILQSTEKLIRQYPVYSMVGAVAVGIILGAAITKPAVKEI